MGRSAHSQGMEAIMARKRADEKYGITDLHNAVKRRGVLLCESIDILKDLSNNLGLGKMARIQSFIEKIKNELED